MGCVLMSKSNHLQSCINSQQCYTGTTKIFPSVPSPPVTLSSCSQADLPANNVASQSAGAIPFGSSSLPGYCSQTGAGQGVAPSNGIHCWQNINDGKLGNSHSWIPGAANAFVGVVFANCVRSKASESLARVQVIAAMIALEALMLWNTPTRCLLDWPQRSGFQRVLSLATISASSFSSSPQPSLQLPSALRCLMLELALMSWRLILPQEGDLQMDSWYEMSWIRTHS